MYQKSFFLVILALLFVAFLNTGFRYLATIPWVSGNPSAYDPKISIEEAVQTSKKPLLVEFYTDTCQTCRQVTPLLAKVKERYAKDLTFVMVNLDDPQQQPFAQIFGVTYVPAVFIFDAKQMHKTQIPLEKMKSQALLAQTINTTLQPPLSK